MTLPISIVRAEFARRKVQFHPNEEANNISLWGLFSWGAISKYAKDGRVILNPGYTKINKIVWCKPSAEEWERFIKPLIEDFTLDDLQRLAGW